ncbi:RecE family exodeoxyribonuclease [Lelliottia aquatilis]|uniref:RecE family exodeoxyribonuclease n=1 Tax=Lelliottia aquatilis TaxID=2080838 RepID=UPI00192B909E|nr:RecE family exodeoxyribonuclease [Lelliottia aquatilis]MBL5882593.1 PD-(D/E)XK nuclease-like domain-containing protein [Lelliottia aquatilis]
MEFFYVVKATQKSGKDDAVVWFTAKSEARANLQLDVELEDAGIETGRGKDYQKPIRTDFPVYDDLPEESTVDYTWCKRYELADDLRTWQLNPVSESKDNIHQNVTVKSNHDCDLTTALLSEEDSARKIEYADDNSVHFQLATMPFRLQLLAQFCAEDRHVYHISIPHRKELSALELDMDNSYVQNMLLAAENSPEIKSFDMPTLWKLAAAIKMVFPQDKRHELNQIIEFTKIWVQTEYIDRGILTRERAAGNRISKVQRTDSGTNSDGGYITDRGIDAHHTLETLDLEIACALLPMDFNHLEIPGSIHRRAKEVVAKKEEPWKSWSAILRNQPGVLAVNRAAIFNVVRIAPENIHCTPAAHLEFVNKTMKAEFNAAVELLPLPAPVVDPDAPVKQPKVENLGGGMFTIDGLMNEKQPEKDDRSSVNQETTSNVQMEEAEPEKVQITDAVSPDQSVDEADLQTVTVAPTDILAAAAPSLASDTASEITLDAPDVGTKAPEAQQDEPTVDYPAFFEPGRYEGLPNNVYHAANGISSTQVKDSRVSLMYFNARHVAKTIQRAPSKVLDMGNLVHALALQPENLEEEFSVEPEIPLGAFTTTSTLREFIDAHNASLPPLLSADDIKALLEEHNATLPAQLPLGAGLEETAQSYMALPAEFQRIEPEQKQTAAAMKACIKEYNNTLPAPVKTSGSRDALLEQLALANPDLVAQEAQKPVPLKVSGTKAEMIQAVKSVKPDAVFADELLDAWRDNPGDKILVTRQQLVTALAIQSSLLAHPTAGMLLQHPSRAVEVSYFGFDEETGLEVRVRPDLEIDLDGVRIGADLKTISMWNVKQEGLRAKLHREIIERDYHLSAAMYCETAALDQFFWIFVNKDENYHWIAIIEASAELLELGMLEYRKAMRAIATGFDTGEWTAPITTDYTDELNDFDLRRLEALRLA